MYNEEIASKKSLFYKYFTNESEKDISSLLQLSPLVMNAIVSVNNVLLPEAVNGNVTLEFIAVCSVQVEQTFDLNDISSSLNSSITDAETNLYEFYDENSLLSLSLLFEKPKIIKIESKSKNEITKLIGLFILLNYAT